GATIKRDEHTGAILVARIMRGGAADRSGAITFKLIPAIKEEMPSKEPKMFVKTLFDYDPKREDKAIPCTEAGLAFKRGDILQIMSQDDANWWQAKQDGHANPRAGLIPSKHVPGGVMRYPGTDTPKTNPNTKPQNHTTINSDTPPLPNVLTTISSNKTSSPVSSQGK
ncbi:unnamed protein product, partial [Coregonus sp. 'balchen']